MALGTEVCHPMHPFLLASSDILPQYTNCKTAVLRKDTRSIICPLSDYRVLHPVCGCLFPVCGCGFPLFSAQFPSHENAGWSKLHLNVTNTSMNSHIICCMLFYLPDETGIQNERTVLLATYNRSCQPSHRPPNSLWSSVSFYTLF